MGTKFLSLFILFSLTAIQAEVLTLPNPNEIPQLCDSTATRTLYVAKARPFDPIPDGSALRPFHTVNDAILAALKARFCQLTVNIARGRFIENLTISLTTTLIGISNDATIIQGSIRNKGFSLTMRSLRIDQATGFGIFQSGGSIDLLNVRVSNTNRLASDDQSGTGIIIRSGAQGLLRLVTIDRNRNGALWVSDATTKVKASWMLVRDNDIRPGLALTTPAPSRIAAVEITNNALFLGEGLIITNNEIINLLIRDSARSQVRVSNIEEVRERELDPYHSLGGFNILVIQRGQLELKSSTTQASPYAGLTVNSHGNVSSTRTRFINNNYGFVIGGSIGEEIDEPWVKQQTYCNIERFPRNIFYGNETNFYSPPIFPDPHCTIHPSDCPPPPTPVCASVPWE